MKRLAVLVLVLMMGAVVTAFAAEQVEEKKKVETAVVEEKAEPETHYFAVQLLYPLSTNKGMYDHTYANFSLLYGRIGRVTGVDMSYLASVVSHDMTGLQTSYVFAYTGQKLTGVAATGIASVVKENTSGVQASGVVSYTGKELKGLQMSGVVNIAGNTSGMQMGVVNIADDVKGVQLGLVNISDQMKGVPIGLVNISDNGGIEVAGWYSNLTAVNTGVRFRAGYVYTMLAFGGWNTEYEQAKDESLSTSFYMGVRIPIWKFYVDMDAGYVALDNDRIYRYDEYVDQMAIQGRGILGVKLYEGFSVFGGGGVSYLLDAGREFGTGSWEPLYLGGAAYEF